MYQPNIPPRPQTDKDLYQSLGSADDITKDRVMRLKQILQAQNSASSLPAYLLNLKKNTQMQSGTSGY